MRYTIRRADDATRAIFEDNLTDARGVATIAHMMSGGAEMVIIDNSTGKRVPLVEEEDAF